MPPLSFLGRTGGQCLFYGRGLLCSTDYFHSVLHHSSARQLKHSSSSPRAVGVHYRSASLCLHTSPSVSYLHSRQKEIFKTLAGSVRDLQRMSTLVGETPKPIDFLSFIFSTQQRFLGCLWPDCQSCLAPKRVSWPRSSIANFSG